VGGGGGGGGIQSASTHMPTKPKMSVGTLSATKVQAVVVVVWVCGWRGGRGSKVFGEYSHAH